MLMEQAKALGYSLPLTPERLDQFPKKEGLLDKKSPSKRHKLIHVGSAYETRYFVLEAGHLLYYKGPQLLVLHSCTQGLWRSVWCAGAAAVCRLQAAVCSLQSQSAVCSVSRATSRLCSKAQVRGICLMTHRLPKGATKRAS